MLKKLFGLFYFVFISYALYAQCIQNSILRQNVCGGCQSGCSLCTFCAPGCTGATGNCGTPQNLSTTLTWTLLPGCSIQITASICGGNGSGCGTGAGADGGDNFKVGPNPTISGSADGCFSDTYTLSTVGTSSVTINATINRRDEQLFITTTPVGSCPSCTLPVEIAQTSFTINETTINLTWQVLSELENEKFIVQHSLDGKTFRTVYTEKGRGTTNIPKEYMCSIENVYSNVSYVRIADISIHGDTTFHTVHAIKMSSDNITEEPFSINSASINSENNIQISVFNPLSNYLTLTIYDISGKIMEEKSIESDHLQTEVVFLTQSYTSGIYIAAASNSFKTDFKKIILVK